MICYRLYYHFKVYLDARGNIFETALGSTDFNNKWELDHYILKEFKSLGAYKIKKLDW